MIVPFIIIYAGIGYIIMYDSYKEERRDNTILLEIVYAVFLISILTWPIFIATNFILRWRYR